MIPQEQLIKLAGKLSESIESAKVYINESETKGNIIKKEVAENKVTVFVSLSEGDGTVTKIEIYDKDGDLVQFQNMNFTKDDRQGYIGIVEIQVEGQTVYEQ